MAVEQHAVLDIEVQTLMSCDFLPCRVDSDQIDERYCHMLDACRQKPSVCEGMLRENVAYK